LLQAMRETIDNLGGAVRDDPVGVATALAFVVLGR
jgi:hypothetical protein